MEPILIYGASKHGRYTADIAECQGRYRIVGYVDDVFAPGHPVRDYTVLGPGKDLVRIVEETGVRSGVVAIGDNFQRSRIVGEILEAVPDFSFATVIHPFSSIAKGVVIGPGTVMMAGAIVNNGSAVGKHCFLATKASLDHDCQLGDFASLSAGVSVGGSVRIGAMTALAIGACTIHDLEIGEHSVIGAGATVLKDVPDRVVAYGTPCRVIRSRLEDEAYL